MRLTAALRDREPTAADVDNPLVWNDAPSMRRLRVVAVIVVSFALACAASSAGARTNSQATLTTDRVIKVLAVNISGRRVQKPPPGITGDVVVGRDRLLNAVPQFGRPRGAVVGQGRYRTVFKSVAVAVVEVTVSLPGGTVRARGKADFRRASNVIRVVGGTGVFAGAKGTAEERVLRNGQTLNIYRLS